MTLRSPRLAGVACALLAATAAGYSGYRAFVNPASALPASAGVDEGPSPDEVEAAIAWCGQSADAKDRLTGEVIAGRLSLPEAAARFRALEAGRPNRYCRTRTDLFPGGSEGERYCRAVITRVVNRLHAEDPAREQEVSARVEAELRDLLARDGAVRLPE
jgi:hypothetical protein